MSILEFVASIISSLAWPMLVGFSVYILRAPAGKLIARISKFKYGELEAEFREVLDDIKPIESKVSERAQLEQRESVSIDLEELADVSPRAAVMEAWILVEKATVEFCEADYFPLSRISYQGLFRASKEKNLDIEHLQTAYQEMRSLRNKVAHASDFDIKPGTARDYVKAAYFISSELGMRKASA